MYLEGEKFYWTDWKNPENNLTEDGFQVRGKTLRVGYWRKHPNLHGYIVQTFAAGVDECQEVELEADDITKIMAAVTSDDLPDADGPFFGESDGSEKEETLAIFAKALEWLAAKESGASRSLKYRASW